YRMASTPTTVPNVPYTAVAPPTTRVTYQVPSSLRTVQPTAAKIEPGSTCRQAGPRRWSRTRYATRNSPTSNANDTTSPSAHSPNDAHPVACRPWTVPTMAPDTSTI